MKATINTIGTLNEKPLHAALKKWIAQPQDELEVKLDGYFIDIIRDKELIEIQTRNLGALKKKLKALTQNYTVNLVYPLPQQKWIVRIEGKTNKVLSRRKSPKHSSILNMFEELVRVAPLLPHPNLKLTVLLIHEDEIRRYMPKKAWRRKGWVVKERHLISVQSRYEFQHKKDYLALLPDNLPTLFTSADVTHIHRCTLYLSQTVLYCLKNMQFIKQVGKKGRYKLYTIAQ